MRCNSSLAITSVGTAVVSLDRGLTCCLGSNTQMRVRKVKCFRVSLAYPRAQAPDSAHTGGIGFGSIAFHTSGCLGRRLDSIGARHSGCGPRSVPMAGRDVSRTLARCFLAGDILAHQGFRSLYKLAQTATKHCVTRLTGSGGLHGVSVPHGPVCRPVPKFCKGRGLPRPRGRARGMSTAGSASLAVGWVCGRAVW